MKLRFNGSKCLTTMTTTCTGVDTGGGFVISGDISSVGSTVPPGGPASQQREVGQSSAHYIAIGEILNITQKSLVLNATDHNYVCKYSDFQIPSGSPSKTKN